MLRVNCYGNLWGETFQIDAWGNLNKILAYSTKPRPESLDQLAGPNNRFTGMSYDAAGNLLYDGLTDYTFNAENQIVSLNPGSITYFYDGDGRRVQKSTGKLYWYGTGSDPLAESDQYGNITNEYVFFNGKRIARRDSCGNVGYTFADHLGTARVVTNSAGVPLDDSDFYPFGGERPVLSSSGNNYKFTGKERDGETGLDEFGARYYSSSLGRFTIPDWAAKATAVPYAEFGNPQTLNLYAYVGNNPLSRADLDGHASMEVEIHAQSMLDDFIEQQKQNQQQPTQQQQPAQNQNQDQTQRTQMQFSPRPNAAEDRPQTDEDKLKALQQAGELAEPGVRWAMVVTAPNYIAMGVIVAADAGALEVGKNVVQGVKNVHEELARPAGQKVGSVIESRVPGGVKAATDFTRAVLSPRNAPNSTAGAAGVVTPMVVERIIKSLFP